MQNAKTALILLGVVIIVLAIGLIYIWDKSEKDLAKAHGELNDTKLEVETLNGLLKKKSDDLKVKEETEAQLKTQLQTATEQAAKDKQAMEEQLAKATNDLMATSAKLAANTQSLTALTTEKTALQGTVQNLNTKVASLDQKIAKLEEELERGEKNRELLLKELASVRLDKANLEKRFNDIGEVRAQYKVLRHDEVLENRRRWIAQGYDGFYTKTGTYQTPQPYTSKSSSYDLKAEIYSRSGTNEVPHAVGDKPGK